VRLRPEPFGFESFDPELTAERLKRKGSCLSGSFQDVLLGEHFLGFCFPKYVAVFANQGIKVRVRGAMSA
jgi:hypothetical protein